jgi:hypothetical protein
VDVDVKKMSLEEITSYLIETGRIKKPSKEVSSETKKLMDNVVSTFDNFMSGKAYLEEFRKKLDIDKKDFVELTLIDYRGKKGRIKVHVSNVDEYLTDPIERKKWYEVYHTFSKLERGGKLC